MTRILIAVCALVISLEAGAATGAISCSGRRRLHRARFCVHERRALAGGEDSLPDRRHAAEGCGWRRPQRRVDPARHRRQRRRVPRRQLRGPVVRQGPAARCGEVLHHPARQRRSRPVEQAERRPAHEVPEVSLHRHGEAAVRARDQGPRTHQSQAGDGHVDGRDARVGLGLHVSRVRRGPGAAGQQPGRDRRPQSRVAQVPDRRDRDTIRRGSTATTPSSRAAWRARSAS